MGEGGALARLALSGGRGAELRGWRDGCVGEGGSSRRDQPRSEFQNQPAKR